MDYSALTSELLKKMALLIRSNPHKQIGEYAGGEICILNYLVYIDGAALPSEMSLAMEISSARIAAILNSLERKEMISRKIDTSDRRKVLVTITDQGKTYVFEKRKHIHRNMERILRQLGENDSNECIRILDRIIEIYYQSELKEN